MNNNLTESSGWVQSPLKNYLGETETFTSFEELPASGYNRLVKGERYGQVFLLKGLKPEYAGNEVAESLLTKEFQLLISMNHPNIVRAYSLEEVDGIGRCIVMEYVDGCTLDEYLARNPSSSARKKLMFQLLDALDHIHTFQQIHRDLKPANLMVTRNGDNLKVIDFGLSDGDRYVVFKEPACTPRYAAPELLAGKEPDCRSDLYSFGIILSQVFPRRYRAIVRRCTRTRRERRFPSAQAVKRRLGSPWRLWAPVLLVIALGAASAWALHSWNHYDSEPFSALMPSGQTLNCIIRDSQAHITPTPDVEGDLDIPPTITYRGRRFPVTHLDKLALQNCARLRHVSFPEGLIDIDSAAFACCARLSDTIILPRSLRFIGSGAFHATGISTVVIRCDSLRSYSFDRPVNTFYNCPNLRTVRIEQGVRSLCPHFLQRTFEGPITVLFPDTLDEIADGFCESSFALRQVRMPRQLRSIAHAAFYNCGLTRIVLPESLELIDCYAFSYSGSIRYIDVGPNVKTIREAAFSGLKNLDTLILRAPVPPEHGNNIFQYDDHPFVFLVPKESLPLYLQDSVYAKKHPQALP